MHLLPDAFDFFFFAPLLLFSSSFSLWICDVYRTLPANGHMKVDAIQYGWMLRACVDVIQCVRVDIIVRQLWGM